MAGHYSAQTEVVSNMAIKQFVALHHGVCTCHSTVHMLADVNT